MILDAGDSWDTPAGRIGFNCRLKTMTAKRSRPEQQREIRERGVPPHL
jgi:hypothetical protein